MRILFDGRMIASSGIGRYIRDSIRALALQSTVSEITIAGSRSKIHEITKEFEAKPKLRVLEYDVPIYSIREQINGSFFFNVHARQYDLVHFPHYNVPLNVPPNSVVTVHDLIHFEYPELFGSVLKNRMAHNVLRRALSVGSIVTVSSDVRNKIIYQHNKLAPKITVVPPYISSRFHPYNPDSNDELFYRIDGKYFLFVGNLKPHKNVDTLLRAFDLLRTSDVQLVIVGGEQTNCKLSQNPRVKLLSNVRDDELISLYRGALALIQPSFVEGFGYPPMEALSCGTLPVVSDIPVFHENMSGEAVYFNPNDALELREIMEQLLHQPKKSPMMPDRFRKRTLEQYGRELVQVYRHVLATNDGGKMYKGVTNHGRM